jgi:hypothetical protein
MSSLLDPVTTQLILASLTLADDFADLGGYSSLWFLVLSPRKVHDSYCLHRISCPEMFDLGFLGSLGPTSFIDWKGMNAGAYLS